jgi:uncharacterized protein YaaR (DUF327 family)
MRDKKEMTKIKHFNPMALREKYDSSYKDYKGKSPFSSFWSDNDWSSRRTDFIDEVDDNGETIVYKKSIDHVALASYRRAISNFVTIVTSRSDIPVIFQSSDSSYTVVRLTKRILTQLLGWLSMKVLILSYQILIS